MVKSNNFMRVCKLAIQLSLLVAFVKCTFIPRPKLIAEFWEHPNFCGASIKVYENERIQDLLNWNDRISSFKVYAPVSLFEHKYGEGACAHLTAGTIRNCDSFWNDKISSIFATNTLSNCLAELYEHKNFCGRKITIARGEHLHWVDGGFNDVISSIVSYGNLRACEHFYGEGICRNYCGRIADVCDLNDRLSSFYDADQDNVVGYFYEHPNFCGRVIKLYANQRITSLVGFNDQITSFKITRPVTVCEHTFHEGSCRTLQVWECGNLRGDWNDRISSIYDECI